MRICLRLTFLSILSGSWGLTSRGTTRRMMHGNMSGESSAGVFKREWRGRQADKGKSLVVAQFNVLADGLSGMDVDKGGFSRASPMCLAWEHRRQKLVDEIMRHGIQPDIVALQEVDHFHDWFQPVLGGMGYDGIFVAKPNSPCKMSIDPRLEDGCALFWKRDTLRLRGSETLNFEIMNNESVPVKTNQVQGGGMMEERRREGEGGSRTGGSSNPCGAGAGRLQSLLVCRDSSARQEERGRRESSDAAGQPAPRPPSLQELSLHLGHGHECGAEVQRAGQLSSHGIPGSEAASPEAAQCVRGGAGRGAGVHDLEAERRG
eukprot:593791-Hanusia_phi.AAC.2